MKFFVSHASEELLDAQRLVRVLRSHGHDVWFDREDIAPGDMLSEKILFGIRSSEVLLVCLSPTAIGSKWVKLEVEEAGRCYKKRVPLIFKDCAIPSGPLTEIVAINMRNPREFAIGVNELLLKLVVKPVDEVAGTAIPEDEWLNTWRVFVNDKDAGPGLYRHYLRLTNHLLNTGELRTLIRFFVAESGSDETEGIQHFEDFFLRFPFSYLKRYRRWFRFAQEEQLSTGRDHHAFALRMSALDPVNLISAYREITRLVCNRNKDAAWTWTLAQQAGSLRYDF